MEGVVADHEDVKKTDPSRSPHFVVIPMMAPGHMIPMVDIALMLAGHGAMVSVLTTPVNASRIKSVIDRCSATGLPIRFIILRFPSVDAGLPEGCESVDALPSRDMIDQFTEAVSLLRSPLERILRGELEEEAAAHGHHQFPLASPPSCVIGGFGHTWAIEVARSFGVPYLIFHGYSSFTHLCSENLHQHRTHERVVSDTEPFELPGVPRKILIAREQLSATFQANNIRRPCHDAIRAIELEADGIVINSFAELEPEYVEAYKAVMGKNVWTVGPVSLIHNKESTEGDRGCGSSVDKIQCLDWLGAQKPRSVVYVSFGSMARLAAAQMVEIGLGLEASNHPFILVVKTEGDRTAEVEEWLVAFEERTKGRGLVIKGWAPQVLIISHQSTGGFLTHCGWNSTLECVTAGLPMITWPLFADQFLNEKLMVEVLGIGVSLGVKHPTLWKEEEKAGVQVGREEVAKAVQSLMDGGDEGEERRRKAEELAEMSRKAMEGSGSSHTNLTMLIEYVKQQQHRSS